MSYYYRLLALVPILLILAYPGSFAWTQSSILDQVQKKFQRQQASEETLRKLRQQEERNRLQKIQSEYERSKSQREGRGKKRQAKTVGPRFLVKKILVSKSGVLLQDEIAEVLEKYQGKYLNIVELQLIVNDINRLYRGQKGKLARALLPPQKIKNGVVKIILIESKMGRIIFENTRLTSPDYLKWALPIEEREITNIGDLEDMFIRFNKTHNSVRVSSRLRPGSGYSETDIIVKITEVDRWSFGLSFDNEGQKATGATRYGLTIQNSSLLGIDDQVVLGGSKSSGHLSGFITYDFPFTPFGTRIKTLYSDSKQDIIDGNFSQLEIAGNSTLLSGKITHPLVANNSWKLDMSAELIHSVATNMLSIFELKSITRKYITAININKYDSLGAWITNLRFHRVFKRESVNETPSGRRWVSKWTAGITRYQALTRNFSLLAKLSAQHGPHFSLPSSESFGLGGANNLSYDSSEFSGDRGHAAELELQYNINWERFLPHSLQGSNFKLYFSLQQGKVTSYQLDGEKLPGEQAVTSIAAGLRSKITSRFNLSITFATPLNKEQHPNRETRSLLFRMKSIF